MNTLTDEERERLYLLSEECAEVIQVVSKILRFGYSAEHPETKLNGTERLEQELGDLKYIIELMYDNDDIIKIQVDREAVNAQYRKQKYLQYQKSK